MPCRILCGREDVFDVTRDIITDDVVPAPLFVSDDVVPAPLFVSDDVVPAPLFVSVTWHDVNTRIMFSSDLCRLEPRFHEFAFGFSK